VILVPSTFVEEHREAISAKRERYETHPAWGTRSFESAETNRLNEAHWQNADDQSVNVWLQAQLPTIRSRSIYESRNNGMVQGVINTFTDDVVGPDGPTLQVQSDDEEYNKAFEAAWKEWFAAPTPLPDVSGASLIKLWVKDLWKCGEYTACLDTDDQAPSDSIQLRIVPKHPRQLMNPADAVGDPNVVMGIRFDRLGRPSQYYFANQPVGGTFQSLTNITPYPPDLVIHRFILEEDGQVRGIPWLNTGLQAAADLRDYDNQVQDAARQIADQSALLYTTHVDAKVWESPEETSVERRTIKMIPPGWQPFVYPATQPAVQYPEYRAERQRELGRPVGMPLLMIRLDASKHNYSSARLDTQSYHRAISGTQLWISGTDRSVGTLNRLASAVEQEAKFLPRFAALRRRPAKVTLVWTWPSLPHVDPTKERTAQHIGLETGAETLTDVLAAEGRDLETHVARRRRERELFEQNGLPLPAWMNGGEQAALDRAAVSANEDDDDDEDEKEKADE
jgi:lambda family phage portal protein